VAWAIEQGVETATFHVMTPYPATALHARLEAEGRILHRDWDLGIFGSCVAIQKVGPDRRSSGWDHAF